MEGRKPQVQRELAKRSNDCLQWLARSAKGVVARDSGVTQAEGISSVQGREEDKDEWLPKKNHRLVEQQEELP